MGRPFYPNYFNFAMAFKTIGKSEYRWPDLYFCFTKEMMTAVLPHKELYEIGEKVFREMILNPKERKKNFAAWRRHQQKFLQFEKNISLEKLEKLSSTELNNKFEKFNQLYVNFWALSFPPEVGNWGGEKILKEKLKRKIKDREMFQKVFEVLSAPEKSSFFEEEETALFEAKNLKTHAKKYFWLQNSYFETKNLQEDYFAKEKKKLLKIGKTPVEIKKRIENLKQKKRATIESFGLSRGIVTVSKALADSIWWQDHRKGCVWRHNHFVDLFLKEISKRSKISFVKLHYALPDEIYYLLLENKIDKQELEKRMENFVILIAREKIKYWTGKTAKKISMRLVRKNNREIKELKGITVSGDKNIKGIVKIIKTPKESKKLKKGEILVTSMTSPDFITVMEKAGAVITDEGGMTCHAAVVTRELGIPCLVGTKHATTFLEDGNKVLVDVKRGTVKKV